MERLLSLLFIFFPFSCLFIHYLTNNELFLISVIWPLFSLPYMSKLLACVGVSPSLCFCLVSTDQEIGDISVHKVSEGQMHEGWSPTLLACLDLADQSLLTILFLWKKCCQGNGMFPGMEVRKIQSFLTFPDGIHI